jgi:hypothetical protein
VSDEYDYGACDICETYHDGRADKVCPRLKRAKKDSREFFRLLAKRFGLDEEMANDW